MSEEQSSLQPQNLEESLRCGICHATFLKPCCLPCGHIFCMQCVETLPDTQPFLCPTCRTELATRDAIVIFGLDDVIDAVQHLLPPDYQEERRQRKRAAEEQTASPVKNKLRRIAFSSPPSHGLVQIQFEQLYGFDDWDLSQNEDDIEEDDPNDPDWLPSQSEEGNEDEDESGELDANDPDWLPSQSEEENEDEDEPGELDGVQTSSEEEES